MTNVRSGLPATAPKSRGWLVRDFVLGDMNPQGVAEMRRQLIAFAAKKPVMLKSQLRGESAERTAPPQAVVLAYKPASKRPAPAKATLKMTRPRHAIAAAR